MRVMSDDEHLAESYHRLGKMNPIGDGVLTRIELLSGSGVKA